MNGMPSFALEHGTLLTEAEKAEVRGEFIWLVPVARGVYLGSLFWFGAYQGYQFGSFLIDFEEDYFR